MTRRRAASPPAGPAPRGGPAEPVAILGAACRLPGAPDMDAAWRLLVEGRDAVTTVPADRFDQDWFRHPRRGEPGKTYTFAAGTLGDVSGFDAQAFGISPREASEMDPQQRLLLELAAEAIEDAGLLPAALSGSGAGVYVGASLMDWTDLRTTDPASGDRYFMTGGALSIIANRLGQAFDLRGPAQTVDTACSSSLLALHLACDALRAGRIPAALVGGVNMLLSPFPFVGFARAGMLSPSGRCQAFDARADGYVRAEGGGVVVLKRLSDALRDGDDVRAVILATGSNAAGRTVGISLPSQRAQRALLETVMAEAAIDPDRVAYFEAHGTGTAIGDPVEATAIGEAIGKRRRTPLPIGSFKSNIGHTEAASGLAGVIKAILVLEKGEIPPSLHHVTPNPAIDFQGLNIRVPTAPEPVAVRDGAVVGVNSFGFGGTNACVLLGRPPARRAAARAAAPAGLPPLLISARSAGALKGLAERWQAMLAARPADAAALLRGAARHRPALAHRLAVRGATPAALADALGRWRDGAEDAPVATGTAAAPADGAPRVVFAFTGNGAPWPGMAQQALAGNATFAAALAEADAALAPHLGWSARAMLARGVTAEELAATEIAQPLLFAVQHATVAALAEQGIRPSLCFGHSVGEVATALCAGWLDLAAAAKLVVVRSRHQARTRGQGRMAALGASAEAAAPVLAELDPALEIAAMNAPEAITVAGPAAALEALAAVAAERRWSFVALDLDYAFHSAAMDGLQAGLVGDLAGLPASTPRMPMISTVTGLPVEAPLGPDYWWRNLRAPVQFRDAIKHVAGLGPALVIEIGPHPVLQSYLRDGLRAAGAEAAVMGSLSRRDSVADPFPGIADRAWTQGADPRGAASFAGPALRRGLPRTPFDRQRHWFAPSGEEFAPIAPARVHPLLGHQRSPAAELWQRDLDTALAPWLADHKLAGSPVLPAAGMLEIALAAGAARFPDAPALELRDAAFLAALPVAEDATRVLRATLDPEGGFALHSRPRLSTEEWTLHCVARVAALPGLPAAAAAPVARGLRLTGQAVRDVAAGIGLYYGPAFAAVTEVVADAAAGRAEVRLDLPDAAPPDADFLLHPARFDGALQGLIGLLGGQADPGIGLVPVKVARLVVRRDAAPAASASITLTARGERSAAADLLLRDALGAPVAVAEGATLQRIRLPGQSDPLEAGFRIDLVPAPPLPGTGPAEAERPDLAAALEAAGARDAALDLGDAALLLDGACTAAAHAALLAAPAGGPLAGVLLAELARLGLAEPGAGGLPQPVAAPDLPQAGEIWRQVLLEQPDLAPDLAWVALALERLPAALAGEAPPDDRVTQGPPAAGAGMARLGRVLAEAAQRLAAGWPAGRPLQVLQIAAAPGPVTAALAAALAAAGRPVTFCAAPLPDRPAPALPPALPGLEASVVPWDPLGSDPPPLVPDLVLGLGAGAALPDPAALPEALRRAAAPGATLLLAEPLPGLLMDATRGQDPAWWTGAAALPPTEAWTAGLAAAGWVDGAARPLRAAPWPSVLLAARAPATAEVVAVPKQRRVLLVADAAAPEATAPLVAALTARGASVALHDLAHAAEHLPPAALQGALVAVLAEAETTADGLARSLSAIARLAATAEGSAAGFRLVTKGGAQPDRGPGHDAAAGAIQALGRVLANENPGLKPRRIDVAPGLPVGRAAARLAAEILAEGGEAEVALTADGRLVPRLRPGLPPPALPAGPTRLALRQPGQLGGLHWAPCDLPAPGAGEVLVRIEAAGLNFRDLMWAQGILPEDVLQAGFAGPGLGMECAGTVVAAGDDTGFRPGDRVFGVAPRALATHALTRAAALAPLPDGIDSVAAATVPVAFLTAIHALEDLGRIAPGERVLIHGGAGAVGLAALQVALARGAIVAATAGTPQKRAFLRAAGAAIALDSRDPGFADALRAHWPDGVDLVLNSLAGEGMERSLGLLRPFGRFLELGKRDFVENRRVGLRPLRRNATFFAVDVDELPRARPQDAARLLHDIAGRLRDGTLRPLPATEFAPQEAESAFRLLQSSGHVGKLVLRPPAGDASAAARPALAEALSGTILVIGGAQGFGLAAARWLAAQGARHLALLSRRGAATPGAEAAVRDLARHGAAATLIACDATDAAALDEALRGLRASLPPLRGIVHAAAVTADGAASAMDPARVARVLAAKWQVAEHLDRLTATDPLALFLMFGSATVQVGNPGQAAYVAANAALETIARRRRAAGRPATVIAWGPIADAGMLAGDAATAGTLRRRLGATPMPAAEALSAIPALLDSGIATTGLARVAWGEARAALAILEEPAFAAVRAAAPDSGDAADLRARLRTLPEDAALGLLRETLSAEIARILRLPAASVRPDAPVAGLGLDSLGGMELRVALEQRLGMAVSLTAVTDTLTVDALARRIAEGLRSSADALDAAAAALIAAHEPTAPDVETKEKAA